MKVRHDRKPRGPDRGGVPSQAEARTRFNLRSIFIECRFESLVPCEEIAGLPHKSCHLTARTENRISYDVERFRIARDGGAGCVRIDSARIDMLGGEAGDAFVGIAGIPAGASSKPGGSFAALIRISSPPTSMTR